MSYRVLPNKTIVDYNKLKVFGFQRANLLNKLYDPLNIRYLKSVKFGKFEMPKNFKNREIHFLMRNYDQTKIYAKSFTPKGIKPTVTSRFTKTDDTEDFQNFNIILMRSGKQYKPNELKFMVDLKYSKPEIKQILSKLYGLDIKEITTAILPGSVKREILNAKSGAFRYTRTSDKKVAVVSLNNIDNIPQSLTSIAKPKYSNPYENEDPDFIPCTKKRIKRIFEIKKQKINDVSLKQAIEAIPEERRFLLALGKFDSKGKVFKSTENRVNEIIKHKGAREDLLRNYIIKYERRSNYKNPEVTNEEEEEE